MKCLFCGNPFVVKAKGDSTRKKFCQSLCQVTYWHHANKSRVTEIRKKSKLKRRDKISAYNKEFYQNNKALFRQWQRERYQRTREEEIQRVINRMRRLRQLGSYTLADWQALKTKYKFTCPHCHRSEPEISLTRDHIVPISKGGNNLISNIQPLCQSCNSRKFNRI